MVAQIETGLGDTGHLLQTFLDQPAAGCTADAVDQQLDLLVVTLGLRVAGLDIRAVEQLQFFLEGLG